MKVQPAVRRETARIAAGTTLLCAVMLGIFALLGKLDASVWWGTLLGYGVAVGNFFLMALSVQRAAARMNGAAEGSDEMRLAKQQLQMSHTGRMLMMAAAGIVALAVPQIHAIPVALSLLFPRLVISIYGFLNAKKKEADRP